MGRRAAIALHLALVLIGFLLYIVFVIPRWWVLTGDIPATLATAGRLAAGIPIGLAALPVLTVLRQALTPSTGTPELALRLRAWSAVLHVVAGVLVLLAAIAEIWLRLEVGGPYLFAVYGAAGSIAVLAIAAFYLSFVAEKPPAAPKPAKAKKPPRAKKVEAKKMAKAQKAKAEKVEAEKKPRGKKHTAEVEVPQEPGEAGGESAAGTGADTVDDSETTVSDETEATEVTEAEVTEAEVTEKTVAEVTETDADETGDAVDTPEAEPAETPGAGGLRNKRPVGKTRRRLRR